MIERKKIDKIFVRANGTIVINYTDGSTTYFTGKVIFENSKR